MELFGVGPFELLIILVIALLVLGPKDMAKTGKMIGRFLRKIITSPEWQTVQKASREIKYLPNRLMREATLEDLSKDLQDVNKIGKSIKQDMNQVGADLSSWTTPPPVTIPQVEPQPQDPSLVNNPATSNDTTPGD